MTDDEATSKARARELAEDVEWYQREVDILQRENDRLWAALVIVAVGMYVIGYLVGALTT